MTEIKDLQNIVKWLFSIFHIQLSIWDTYILLL